MTQPLLTDPRDLRFTSLALGLAFCNVVLDWGPGYEIDFRPPALSCGRRTPVGNEANTERGAAA